MFESFDSNINTTTVRLWLHKVKGPNANYDAATLFGRIFFFISSFDILSNILLTLLDNLLICPQESICLYVYFYHLFNLNLYFFLAFFNSNFLIPFIHILFILGLFHCNQYFLFSLSPILYKIIHVVLRSNRLKGTNYNHSLNLLNLITIDTRV